MRLIGTKALKNGDIISDPYNEYMGSRYKVRRLGELMGVIDRHTLLKMIQNGEIEICKDFGFDIYIVKRGIQE